MVEAVVVIAHRTNHASTIQEVDGRASKESSDIVIMDDNFALVVKVVWRGRLVYNNIQKFI